MLKYILLFYIACSFLISTAQVHVRDEPRHHNVFENQFVRILDVFFGPKDTTLYHLHNTPSVFIVFTNTNVGSQLLGQQPQLGANLSGEITYDKIANPRIHKVWNADTNWFHVMDIELVGKKETTNLPPIKNDLLSLLFNEKEVNGYRVELKLKQELHLPASTNGYLLVSLSEAAVDHKTGDLSEHRFMKPGHYSWINAGKSSFLSLMNHSSASFVLLQLK